MPDSLNESTYATCARCGESAGDCRGPYDGRECDGTCLYCRQQHDEYDPCHTLCEEHGGDNPHVDYCPYCLQVALFTTTEYHRARTASGRQDGIHLSRQLSGERWDAEMWKWRAIQDENRRRNSEKH